MSENNDANVRPDRFDGGCAADCGMTNWDAATAEDAETVTAQYLDSPPSRAGVADAPATPDDLHQLCDAWHRSGYTVAMCAAIRTLQEVYPPSSARSILVDRLAAMGCAAPGISEVAR